LHRNLRPSNLIRRTHRHGEHEIVVMDVGAARVVGLEADTHVELESYYAPEQQDGNALAVSDLYSIGPILVYLLTGQVPNQFYKFVGDEFRLAVEMVPGLQPEMRALLTKLTNPKPSNRHNSAQELAASLRQLLTTVP
jgi:serine/threonine-protein kinase